MSTVTLIDYSDLYTAICEELKVPTSDGVTLGRIKRDINMIYLDHVIPFKPRAWWWLEQKQDVQTFLKITTGTVTVTNGSTAIAFSSPPAASVAEYWFRVAGQSTIFKIATHTGGAAAATLDSPWQDTSASGKGFTLWKDHITLDSGIKEVVMVTHDRRPMPLDVRANVNFDEQRARNPGLEGYPFVYNATQESGNAAASAARILRWWPAADNKITTLHVTGRKHASKLINDSDEPLMPVEDRIVIFYGACSRAWARERNESEATKNWNLFQMKLAQMAGKSEDAPNVTEVSVDPDYLTRKRYRRLLRSPQGRRWESE
jgi:hypothetical protein